MTNQIYFHHVPNSRIWDCYNTLTHKHVATIIGNGAYLGTGYRVNTANGTKRTGSFKFAQLAAAKRFVRENADV